MQPIHKSRQEVDTLHTHAWIWFVQAEQVFAPNHQPWQEKDHTLSVAHGSRGRDHAHARYLLIHLRVHSSVLV